MKEGELQIINLINENKAYISRDVKFFVCVKCFLCLIRTLPDDDEYVFLGPRIVP